MIAFIATALSLILAAGVISSCVLELRELTRLARAAEHFVQTDRVQGAGRPAPQSPQLSPSTTDSVQASEDERLPLLDWKKGVQRSDHELLLELLGECRAGGEQGASELAALDAVAMADQRRSRLRSISRGAVRIPIWGSAASAMIVVAAGGFYPRTLSLAAVSATAGIIASLIAQLTLSSARGQCATLSSAVDEVARQVEVKWAV